MFICVHPWLKNKLSMRFPLLPLVLTFSSLVAPALHAAAAPTEVTFTRPTRGDIVRYVTVPGTL